MSAPNEVRVDASHPVLSQIVEAANKGFSGTLEITTKDSAGRDLQVTVLLESGLIRGVSANGWVAPAAAYVLHATGQDFSEEGDPLRAAYAAEKDGAPGVPLLDADAIDTARRDWAYGLLASTLTWDRPKVRKVKGGTFEGDKFVGSQWQQIVSDLAHRTEAINGNWAVVCRELANNGISTRPAAQAAPMLGVGIFGHPLFDGTATLDHIAGRTGQSRAAVLSDLAGAILSGAQPQFAPLAPADEHLWIPEDWDDPESAWGVVPADGAFIAPIEPQVEVEPEPEPVIEPVSAPDEVDSWSGLLESTEAVEPPVLGAPTEQGADEESAWGFDEVPAEQYDEVAPEPVVEEPIVQPYEGDDPRLLEEFVEHARDDDDRDIRNAVAERVIASARAEVAERQDDLDAALAAVEGAATVADSAREAAQAAAEALRVAQEALAAAEAEVQAAKDRGAEAVAVAEQASVALDEAEKDKASRDEDVERVKAMLAHAEAEALTAAAMVTEAAAREAQARWTVENEVQPAIDAAQSVADEVTTTQVTPASTAHTEASDRLQDAEQGLAVAHDQAGAAQNAVARAQAVVAYLVAEQEQQTPVEPVEDPVIESVTPLDTQWVVAEAPEYGFDEVPAEPVVETVIEQPVAEQAADDAWLDQWDAPQAAPSEDAVVEQAVEQDGNDWAIDTWGQPAADEASVEVIEELTPQAPVHPVQDADTNLDAFTWVEDAFGTQD